MSLKTSSELFISSPRFSIALGLLCFVLGIAFVSGVVPDSASRIYLPGHNWILAIISWILALFFCACGFKGLKLKSNSGND